MLKIWFLLSLHAQRLQAYKRQTTRETARDLCSEVMGQNQLTFAVFFGILPRTGASETRLGYDPPVGYYTRLKSSFNAWSNVW